MLKTALVRPPYKNNDWEKATGSDGIPVKILKIARNVINSHLANIINRDKKENTFSGDVKNFSCKTPI